MEFLNEDHAKKGQKIALEMGGASGENAILLGYTDVDKVYNIDIDPLEIAKGEFLKKQFLSSNVSKKLEFITGNCFDILRNTTPACSKSRSNFLSKPHSFLQVRKTSRLFGACENHSQARREDHMQCECFIPFFNEIKKIL